MSVDKGAYQRRLMVDRLARSGITDRRVLDAVAKVPRHLFVPEAYARQAYQDELSIGIDCGQTISQPRVVARMSEAAELHGDERVLEIGTGSGYQAAILAELSRFVLSIERHAPLARSAKARLRRLGYDNVSIKVMDGSLGWRAEAPFEAIVVTAGAPEIPRALVEQLADGGRLVIPVGPPQQQVLKVVRRRGERIVEEDLEPARFVPLIGRGGFKAQ